MEQTEAHKCFDGELQVWLHESSALSCDMGFSIYLPETVKHNDVPAVTFLSGLTCNHENFTTKAGAYKKASELGMAVIAPDTSPRGDHVPDDEDSYDFGKGAGFYINAMKEPWNDYYRMEDYIADELYNLISEDFPVQKNNQSIMGHSMGGHGALTLFFKYPQHYKSVSAFSPIVAPTQVPWGQKAFAGYLGENKQPEWVKHDAAALVAHSEQRDIEILIDQGLADNFLKEQLRPELFEDACKKAGQNLKMRKHPGFDHSYYFIQSFIDDHLDHHAGYLQV